MSQNYFADLEKIANDAFLVEDYAHEPMVEPVEPTVDPGEIEAIQATNSELPVSSADEQLPTSPEDVEALKVSLAEAEANLQTAKETLASAEKEMEYFEKNADEFKDVLIKSAAFAKLIEFSTSDTVDESLRKLASDRFTTALLSEDAYNQVIEKTASELFQDPENLELLYSQDGLEYVLEHLASFIEDEELEKAAFEMGGIYSKAKEIANRAYTSVRDFHKINDEIEKTRVELKQLENLITEKSDAIDYAERNNNFELAQELLPDLMEAEQTTNTKLKTLAQQQSDRALGGGILGGGAASLVGGSVFAGKKLSENAKKDDVELSEKTANVTINPEEFVNEEGGIIDMSQSIVKDFLKIAGAAVLLDVANDANQADELRKEATDMFNSISRMGRKDMEENLVKVATEMYTETELHEIVSGKHNEELFSKIAWFTDAYEMPADELEKIAGAESVAAKGVGGALTDAKANIVEKVEADKVKTETVANGETGSKKADDMRGYNVINNPSEYQVDKTAATKTMIEEAELRKEAAYRSFVEADTFIKNNIAVLGNN